MSPHPGGSAPFQCGEATNRTMLRGAAQALLDHGATAEELAALLAEASGHFDCPDCFPVPFYQATAALGALRRLQAQEEMAK